MRIEELAWVCQEAARDLVERGSRPYPTTIVLPSPQATRVVTIPDFPPDDAGRAAVLDAFARDEILESSRPAYGFIAEAELAGGGDVLVVVYGAHSHPPQITAAGLGSDGELGEFADPEPLDPAAMPFIHPLQHAVEEVEEAPEPPGIPGFGDGMGQVP